MLEAYIDWDLDKEVKERIIRNYFIAGLDKFFEKLDYLNEELDKQSDYLNTDNMSLNDMLVEDIINGEFAKIIITDDKAFGKATFIYPNTLLRFLIENELIVPALACHLGIKIKEITCLIPEINDRGHKIIVAAPFGFRRPNQYTKKRIVPKEMMESLSPYHITNKEFIDNVRKKLTVCHKKGKMARLDTIKL